MVHEPVIVGGTKEELMARGWIHSQARWVKQCHHHSTSITLNTNLLKRQMDPAGKRRKREYFTRLTCEDRSGKGQRVSGRIHRSCFQNF